MRPHLIVVPLVAVALAACSTRDQRSIVSAPANVQVELTKASVPARPGPHLLTPADGEKEVALWQTCTSEAAVKTKGVVATAIAGFAVNQLIGYVVDAVDRALQKELEKYTQVFGGHAYGQFYGAGRVTALGYKCVRITRTYRDASGDERIAMDFVAALDVQPPAALGVQPLRLYYAKAQALSGRSGTYGLSISLAMDAIWRADKAPKQQAAVVDAVVFTDKITLKPEAYVYRTYKTLGGIEPSEAKPMVQIALVPWSYWDGVDVGATSVKVAMTVAEAGNAPWWLEKGSALFSKNADKINEKVQAAVAQLLKDRAGLDISQ